MNAADEKWTRKSTKINGTFTSERHGFTTDANHERIKTKHQPIDSHLELISCSPLKIAKNV
jgi:hypothetical protein